MKIKLLGIQVSYSITFHPYFLVLQPQYGIGIILLFKMTFVKGH